MRYVVVAGRRIGSPRHSREFEDRTTALIRRRTETSTVDETSARQRRPDFGKPNAELDRDEQMSTDECQTGTSDAGQATPKMGETGERGIC